MERLEPKPSTLKALFARCGNECSFSGCIQPIVDDRGILVGEVCHINAVKKEDARYNASLSSEYLRSYDNLILLCHAHHRRIDALAEEFSVEALTEMRAFHEKRVSHKVFTVSDQLIDDALLQLLEIGPTPHFWSIIDHFMREISEDRVKQSGVNWMSASVCELLDTQLYILTLRALAKAPLPLRSRLLREHLEWCETRLLESHAAVESHGGSLAKWEFNSKFNQLTEERIKVVRRAYLHESV
ncbi:MAG TPA: HNH endonuclease [Chthoniobacterales bacterium]